MENKKEKSYAGFYILGFACLVASITYNDWQKDNQIKEDIAAGKGKQISFKDLGIIDGCHIKHYIVKDNQIVDGKLIKHQDAYYTANCNNAETETRRVQDGKFSHDEYIVKKKSSEEYVVTKKPKM